MEALELIIKGIAKVVWKAFLITIYGVLILLETILHFINNYLKDAIK